MTQSRNGGLGTSGAIRIARKQLGKALKLIEGEPASDRDTTVHEVRKRIKRARALVSLARAAVGRKAIEKADRRLREAARPLSRVRDASVLVATIDSLADRSLGIIPSVAFDQVRPDLQMHRDRVVRDELEEGDALATVAKALRSTRRRLGRWDPGDDHSEPIEAVKRTYKRARDAYGLALSESSPEALHELRKRTKAFAYQLGYLGLEPDGPVARAQKLGSLLGDELGEIHDLDVLRPIVASRVGATPILTTLDRRRLDLRRVALQRAGVVFFDKPRKFLKGLAASLGQVEKVRGDG